MSATGVGEAEKSKHCALASLTPPAAGFHAQRFFHGKAEESPKTANEVADMPAQAPVGCNKGTIVRDDSRKGR
jgi:hypothetical protein